MEKAGELSERISFERRMGVRGLAGEASANWMMVGEAWASLYLVPRADHLRDAGDTRHTARQWKVTLRKRPDLEAGMRLRWGDKIFALTGVEAMPGRLGWMTVWAEEIGANLSDGGW